MATKSKKNYLKGKVCLNCGCPDELEIDHIYPKVYGFNLAATNKQPLCWKCNRDKAALIIDYHSRTLVLQPYMFQLNKKGLKECFGNSCSFFANLFNPLAKDKVQKLFKTRP